MMLASSSPGAFAHPGLDPDNGEPCPFVEQKKQEDVNELRGRGYERRLPTRGLAELRAGDGGIPDGGYAAVEKDLIALMTKENPAWPTGKMQNQNAN